MSFSDISYTDKIKSQPLINVETCDRNRGERVKGMGYNLGQKEDVCKMTEQYIQLLKTNPEVLFWGQALAVIAIGVIFIVQFVIMLVLCSRLKKQMKRIDTTIDQAKQYLDVIMESDESEPDRKLSTQKASTAPLSAGRTAYKSSSEKTGENTGKSSYEEDTNHIISAVLDEVFQ